MTDTFIVFLSKILCGKDSCTGHSAKDTQIVYKYQLIDNSNPRHLLRSDLTNHDVVQQAYKVCDSVLDHDRYGDGKYHLIKLLVSNKFFPYVSQHKSPFYPVYSVFKYTFIRMCHTSRPQCFLMPYLHKTFSETR